MKNYDVKKLNQLYLINISKNRFDNILYYINYYTNFY